jgi:hypothetical protein
MPEEEEEEEEEDPSDMKWNDINQQSRTPAAVVPCWGSANYSCWELGDISYYNQGGEEFQAHWPLGWGAA